jgi:hypothetical protein
MKAAVCGISVGGFVKQDLAVTLSAPKVTVCPILISKGDTRPVTLSRAANTASEFEIMAAACAGAAKARAASNAAIAGKAFLGKFTMRSDGGFMRCGPTYALKGRMPISFKNCRNNGRVSAGGNIATLSARAAGCEVAACPERISPAT